MSRTIWNNERIYQLIDFFEGGFSFHLLRIILDSVGLLGWYFENGSICRYLCWLMSLLISRCFLQTSGRHIGIGTGIVSWLERW